MDTISRTKYTEGFINDINGLLKNQDPVYVIETYFMDGIPTLSEVNRRARSLGFDLGEPSIIKEIYRELVCPSTKNIDDITRKVLYSNEFEFDFLYAKKLVLDSKKGGSNKHRNKRTHKRTRRNHKRV